MEIKKVSLDMWEKLSNSTITPSIEYKAEFITIIAEAFDLKPVAWVVSKGSRLILGLQTFSKNAKLVHPSTYLYTSIWTNGAQLECQEAQLQLLRLLKSEYKAMHFLFSPKFSDVRPFIRSGFQASVNYTLLRYLDELSFCGKLKARENRARVEEIKFFWGDRNKDVLEQYRREFIRWGFSNGYSRSLEILIMRMMEYGYAKALTARKDGKLMASGILIVDRLNKHSMNILISSEKKHYETGVHTALYMEIFRQLKKDGYRSNDLFGANTLGIGNFKANFSDDLVPHFEVRYNYMRSALSKHFHKMTQLVNRILRY